MDLVDSPTRSRSLFLDFYYRFLKNGWLLSSSNRSLFELSKLRVFLRFFSLENLSRRGVRKTNWTIYKGTRRAKTLDIYRTSICLLMLLKKSFQLRGGKRNWTFDDLIGVPHDSICRVKGSVAVSPELKHPTTKHLAQILGNKIPRIFHTRYTYTCEKVELSALLDKAEDIEIPVLVFFGLSFSWPRRERRCGIIMRRCTNELAFSVVIYSRPPRN